MSGLVVSAVSIPQQNHLLAALPADVADRIFPNLRPMQFQRRAVLYRSGERPCQAYFPVDSVVALVHRLANGASTEISLVGNEGLVGVTSLMGGESAHEAVVLCAGFAYELPMPQLREVFNCNGDVVRLLLRYAQSLMTQVGQTAVCSRYHSICQRLSSLLLYDLDRVPGTRLALTHELIAEMLGVRRESITITAQQLQKTGAVAYGRGHVTVLDRLKLEQLACECYTRVKEATACMRPDLNRL